MINFRNFKTAPYDVGEMTVVLYAICKLIDNDPQIPKTPYDYENVAKESNRIESLVGVVERVPDTYDIDIELTCFQVQRIIDKLTVDGKFSIEQIKNACVQESKLHP